MLKHTYAGILWLMSQGHMSGAHPSFELRASRKWFKAYLDPKTLTVLGSFKLISLYIIYFFV